MAQGGDGLANLAGMAGDVDDGVEGFLGERGEAVGGFAVDWHEAGAGRDLAGDAPGGAGYLVAVREGLGGDRAA